MKIFQEHEAEKVSLKDGRSGYFFSSSGSTQKKITILVKDGYLASSKSVPIKKTRMVATASKKKKINTSEFKVLSDRLKAAKELKTKGKYHELDFDKLIDGL
jgi:selenocysteine-specific translation elongation factor